MTHFAASDVGIAAISAVVTGFVGVIVGFFTSYVSTRAQRLADRAGFQQVLAETRQMTSAIQRIEQEFSREHLIGSLEIAHRQRQLAEFYGPIYASLKLSGKLWKLLSDGKIGSIRPDVMDLFRAQNERIIELLQTKFDLVEGETIPPSFARFATSATLFNLGTRVGEDNNNPPDVDGLPEAGFSEEFMSYIVNTTEQLKRELHALYESNAFCSMRSESNRIHKVL